VALFGVSFDTPDENRAFVEKFNFPFPLLCDEDRALGLSFGACDSADARNAKRITVVIGPDGIVQQIINGIDCKTHPAELLASL